MAPFQTSVSPKNGILSSERFLGGLPKVVPFQMSVSPKNGILSSERFWSGLSEVVLFQMSVSAKNGILSDERTQKKRVQCTGGKFCHSCIVICCFFSVTKTEYGFILPAKTFSRSSFEVDTQPLAICPRSTAVATQTCYVSCLNRLTWHIASFHA